MPRRKNRNNTSDSKVGGAVCGGASCVVDGSCAGGKGTAAAAANAVEDNIMLGGVKSQLSPEEWAQKKAEKKKARKKRKKESKSEKAKSQIDIDMEQLLYTMTDPNDGTVKREKLMDHLEKEALEMYPHIGNKTIRVPHAYINSGKESDEYVSDYKPPQDNDRRSDRAESFFGDCAFHLSENYFLHSAVGPFFLITSYEYQHYLARLKDHFQNNPEERDGVAAEILRSGETALPGYESISSPATSSDDAATTTTAAAATKCEPRKGRGEIDMLILCRNHVIFCEIKAVGDNFEEHHNTDKSVLDKLWAIKRQLRDDLRVFSHVMKNVLNEERNSETYAVNYRGGGELRKSLVAVLPNLEQSCIDRSFQMDPDLAEAYKEMGIKILTKEQMPSNRYDIANDLDRFAKWWIENVFSYACQEDGTLLAEGLEHLTLSDEGGAAEESTDESPMSTAAVDKGLTVLKRIVGRYLGLLSVVQVSKTTKLSPYHVEARSEGQMIWYIGKRFSDIVLTPHQRQYVEENHPYGYLYGPPGSGKTVVLAVRARKWILNDKNFVVIINMYRGCTKGRVIGRQMYNTVTRNFSEDVQEDLQNHCLQFPADVDTFSDADFQRLKMAIHSHFGEDLGEDGSRLLFIVDETYVQDYWNSVYQPLRENFKRSSMWCAGLFGKEPKGFKSFSLTKVMRCPPAIQGVLWLIDWVEERKKCYSQCSVDAQLPTNGAHVITVRHHSLHGEHSAKHPSQCPECGKELASLLQQLDVEKPASPHQRSDLKNWSLRCSDIVILVGMPRWLFRFHKPRGEMNKPGYLDTTIRKYQAYMQCYQNCPFVEELQRQGYPVRVHTDLSCPGLLPPQSAVHHPGSSRSKSAGVERETSGQQQLPMPDHYQVINLTWVYTYQGMENKVIVFIPGDHIMPQGQDIPTEWTDPELNIPCPGLFNDTMQDEDQATTSGPGETNVRGERENLVSSNTAGAAQSGSGSLEVEGSDSDSSTDRDTDSEELGSSALFPQSTRIRDSAKFFKKEDIDMYGRWDKNNLLISGSRCTSLLVMVTCGMEPLDNQALCVFQQESGHFKK